MTSFVATICKEFTFDAAHYLPTVPEGHKCQRMHGHTYRVELVLRDRVHDNGFVGGLDYEDIAAAWKTHIHDLLDHRVLNEVDGLEVPSTEHVGKFIFDRLLGVLPSLRAVRVHESSTTWCEVGV